MFITTPFAISSRRAPSRPRVSGANGALWRPSLSPGFAPAILMPHGRSRVPHERRQYGTLETCIEILRRVHSTGRNESWTLYWNVRQAEGRGISRPVESRAVGSEPTEEKAEADLGRGGFAVAEGEGAQEVPQG